MATAPVPQRMSVDEYLALDRASIDVRYEYYDGMARERMRGNLLHSSIKINVMALFEGASEAKQCRAFGSDARVQLGPACFVYPDVTVSCANEEMQGDLVRWPSLVVEVIAADTESIDRGIKSHHYRHCPSITEYLLINSAMPQAELFRRDNDDWRYLSWGSAETVHLISLNLHIPVAELYRGIEFPPDRTGA